MDRPVILRPLPLRVGTKVYYRRAGLIWDRLRWQVKPRTMRWTMRRALSLIPGVAAYQHGWTIGKRRFFQISVSRRDRAARWSYEYHRPKQDEFYRYIQFGWASPRVHRWWARSITFYIG
jgi:hypothetical protein